MNLVYYSEVSDNYLNIYFRTVEGCDPSGAYEINRPQQRSTIPSFLASYQNIPSIFSITINRIFSFPNIFSACF
jgi:hypothetical protein